MKRVQFKLNGVAREIEAGPDQLLIEALRETFKLKSVKAGCSPQRECGSCLILFNGQPKLACSVRTEQVEGRSIVTLEGVSDNERKLYADAFVAAAGLQCGFCTPGLVLRIKWMTEQGQKLSRAEIAKLIDGHLCRCTGYTKIIDAVELIQEAKLNGGALPKLVEDGGVGQRLGRYQGIELALGERPFVADIDAPGLLYGALTLSAHARALVKRIDVSKALALRGVFTAVTARDVPGDRWVGQIYADWPVFVAEGEEARYVGDVLAAVAAETPALAREAAALVEVEYEPLPAVLDPTEAIQPGAPQINPKHDNRLSTTRYARGDVETALAASAHTVSGQWRTQRIEHLFMEPEACMAKPLPDGRLHIYSQSQGVFDDRRQVASVLGVPQEQIFIELAPNGGGFGGKEDMTIQAQTALLAHVSGRPVRIELNREESVRMHPKRHPLTMNYTVGCDAEGRLTAVKADIIGDSGAYASVGGKVLERAAGHACGPYRVPVLEVEAIAAYTNNPPCGAMRGFGVNQTNFAIEGCLDLLAAKVGLDGWEIRHRNIVRIGDMTTTGQILEKSVGAEKTLIAVKPAYDAARAAGRAVGLACGIKNSGLGNGFVEIARSRIVVRSDGAVELHTSFTEMGQGLYTIMTQIAVETTGLPASVFRPQTNSTFELGGGQTTGSRGSLLAGNSLIDSARKLKVDLDSGLTLADLAGKVYEGEVRIDDTTAAGQLNKEGKVKTHTAYGFATQVVVLNEKGAVDKVIAAHDVGRALNPQQCEAQVQGAVHMGLGYALTEELPCKDGFPVTAKLRDIGVLRAQHMPQVEVILVEDHEPEGPYGAKGVGEIGLVPTAAAVAGALAAFDGVRRMRLPMKDSPAAKAINVGRIPDKDRELWR